MRIGELAAMAGVSTRAIRHYHHRGLLPEPSRQPNGYRDYGLRDAIALARIRRLTGLGLTLDEVRDALADDRGCDLAELLTELDHDLAQQESRIRDRRARLAVLIKRAGELDADSTVSPAMADLFDRLGEVPDSPMARTERELLALLDTTVAAGEKDRILAGLRELADDPAAVARGREIHRRLDELAGAAVDDPRIAPLAAEVARSMPPGLTADLADPFSVAVLAAFAPAQAEVIRRAIESRP